MLAGEREVSNSVQLWSAVWAIILPDTSTSCLSVVAASQLNGNSFLLSPLSNPTGGCLILPKFDIPKERTSPAPTDALKTHTSGQSPSENCARIRDLSFTASTHITMYGQHFEVVSDPFGEGDYTAVHAISRDDLGIRALRLPVSILVGLPDVFRRKANAVEETP
jgi:hypothetical protein